MICPTDYCVNVSFPNDTVLAIVIAALGALLVFKIVTYILQSIPL